MAATLRIRLLGYFGLSSGDQPITGVRTARLQSLLAYLLLHRDAPQSRQHLAYVFWPDASESQARHNLRQFLHQLRRAFPDADRFIRSDASTVSWHVNSSNTVDLDVAEFEHVLADAAAAEQSGDVVTARERLERATAIYRGDLLPGCYDDWITGVRDELRSRCIDARRRLARLLEGQREYAAAIPHVQHLIELDPLNESSYLDLMRLNALNGNPAAAARVYQRCAATLRRELGVAPSAAIRRSAERILAAHGSGTPQSPDASADAPSLVGRQREWEQLRSSWYRASAGESHLLLISGEAGIGKTRLAEQLLTWASQQGFTVARTRSYAAEGRLALSPVTEWLRSDAIRQSMTGLANVWLSETARLLPELLAERLDVPRPKPMTEFSDRQRLFEGLARAVLSAPQPLLLLIDDLQWCDQETLEWLHFFLRFDPPKRLLVVGTLRVEDVVPPHPVTQWLAHLRTEGRVSELALTPLDPAETATLGAQISKRGLDVISAARLYRETEGYPLFVVEMARAGFRGIAEESGRSAQEASAPPFSGTSARLPPRMYAVIAGRLAGLSPTAQELAGLAAAVGRVFTVEVLTHASGIDVNSLTRGLDELWQRRIVRPVENRPVLSTPSSTASKAPSLAIDSYDFSHDKIRDVAYAELGPMQRRYWHARIARAMEAVYGADLDLVSAQLAAHYERAGEAERAIEFYRHAAEAAQHMYAYRDAISLLEHGLVLLHNLSWNPERKEQQLNLLVLLGLSLVATRGYGAPEVLDILSRAQALNQELGRPPDPLILRGLAIANLNISDFQQGHLFGEKLLQLGQHQDDPILVVEGHYVLGVTLFWTGSFAASCDHLERALGHYDPAQSQAHISRYSQDPKAVCLCRRAFDLWCLGYPDQARAVQRDALTQARAVAHPFSLAYALTWDAMLHGQLGKLRSARAAAEAAIALSDEHDLGLWPAWATVLWGWAQAVGGEPEQGVLDIQRGHELMRATGALFLHPFVSALLADQFASLGHVERGLQLVHEALAGIEPVDRHWCSAELHRLRGKLLLAKGVDAHEVEKAYRRAIEVAQGQEAKVFELRATTSLAQLWQEQRRSAESRQLVAPVYGWFTEGFDTPDLKAAQAFLEASCDAGGRVPTYRRTDAR